MARTGTRRGIGWYRAAVGGLALALLLVAPAALASAPVPADAAYASDDTGAVHIVVPAALPSVDLTQDANHSIGASLVLDRIVEVNTSSGSPQIVAAASVTSARTFNATGAAGGDILAGLSANLTVFHSSGALFP